MPMNIYTFNNNRNSSEDHIKTLKDIASEHHYNIHIFKYTNKDELVFDCHLTRNGRILFS